MTLQQDSNLTSSDAVDDIVIRDATEADRAVIQGLLHGSLRRNYDGDHVAQADRIIDAHLGGGKDPVGHFSKTQHVYVAECGGEVVGVMNIAEKRQGTMKISPLIVNPDFRGSKGAGSALLAKSVEVARARGVRQLYGTVAEPSSWIETFYLNRGWTCGSQSNSQYRPGVVEHAIYYNVDDAAATASEPLKFEEYSPSKYEELERFLTSRMDVFVDGIDEDFVRALVAGHERRGTREVEAKYKEIYLGYESDVLSSVIAFGPKKGGAVKLMPLSATSQDALRQTLRFAQSWAEGRTHKLYTHQHVDPAVVTAFQSEMWTLEGLLPEAYAAEKVAAQWGWLPGETTHLGRNSDRLKAYTERFLTFVQDRGWDRLEEARSLAMAVGGEAGELLAELQWLSEPEVVELLRTDREFKTRVSFEAADILNYLIRLARYCEFDLIETADKKLAVNIDRFPVDEVHGLKGTRYKTGR
ncbi:GNAT family N-acetyltransferase [Streptomyces sp. MA25(2023)]|uniref:GNAT family N-acetyltransferase n=1 Tax=Streptomyces sp. MA25(2023) TaxID=3055078 RepID=UPI0025B2242E|nr:GNAT family N-acetyltransferase [Streptomyces sp. MA25(2023)]MDN3257722.1 GNAT family N-acetyltransferase [Streptomyces sp. MA25(2023)]